MKRSIKKLFTVFTLGLGLISCGNNSSEKLISHPNVLFIIVDDMNVDLQSYGGPVVSPHIDQLAAGGIQFNKAYVQQPVCAASRASFLTGLRPNSTGVDYPYSHYFMDEILPGRGTISRFFTGQGYDVKQFGKVHHGIEDEHPTFQPKKKGQYYNPEIEEKVKSGGPRQPYEKSFGGDEEYVDYKVADSVARAIQSHDPDGAPFFYVAGLKKPHLIFAAPEKYWDLYNEAEIALPQPRDLAEGSPDFAVERYYLKQYVWETDDPNQHFSENYSRLIRHSYYASSSFVDAQLGHIMNALKESGLEEETLVVFVSDHGFLMGEHNYWGKTNLFEKGLKVPLFLSWKGHVESGLKTDALVEAVDIFPTLADMAGFEIPKHLEGTSFKAVTSNPDIEWKKGVFSQQPRGNNAEKEGVSMRTDRYRYTEWTNTFSSEVIARELYDYEKDPTESLNLATLPANAQIIEKLSAQLNEGWKAQLPPGVSNVSDNPLAPPSYAWGKEGVGRRKAWHKQFGGIEEEGWRKATERRAAYTYSSENQ